MAKPRVFISHSGTGDPETLALISDLSAALREDGFSVRVDKEHLKLGESWRSTINTWLGGCHAAVVLLTSKALESAYVTYEVSVLTFRPDALVIPVFLNGVGDAEVRAKGLSATNIQEAHGIVAQNRGDEDRTPLVERIKQGLQPLKADGGKLTPIDRQARHLANILNKLDEGLLEQYLNDLDPERDAWEQEGKPHHSLAIKLLSRGIEGDREELSDLLIEMMGDLGKKAVQDIFELMATSWVDLQAVKCVTEAARGERASRAIAMNGEAPTLAALYVLRASGRASKGWDLAHSLGIIEEPAADAAPEQGAEDDGKKRLVAALTRNIKGALAEHFKVVAPDTVEAALRDLSDNGQPVFVALPAAGVDGEVLAGLRAALPTVTFFFLAGRDESQQATLSSANVSYIVPPLDDGFEKEFCAAYDARVRLFRRQQ